MPCLGSIWPHCIAATYNDIFRHQNQCLEAFLLPICTGNSSDWTAHYFSLLLCANVRVSSWKVRVKLEAVAIVGFCNNWTSGLQSIALQVFFIKTSLVSIFVCSTWFIQKSKVPDEEYRDCQIQVLNLMMHNLDKLWTFSKYMLSYIQNLMQNKILYFY